MQCNIYALSGQRPEVFSGVAGVTLPYDIWVVIPTTKLCTSSSPFEIGEGTHIRTTRVAKSSFGDFSLII